MSSDYSISIASGTTLISGGNSRGDVGILLSGDSNICGAGGGVNPSLDATVDQVYQLSGGEVIAVDTESTPYFDHTLNSGLNEVGPSLKFVDKYSVERGNTRRVVGLPSGDSGSGFSTSQWLDGQEMYDLSQSLTDAFLSLSPFNTLGAVLVVLGANDTGDFSPDTLWRDAFDNFIQEYHSTAFVGNSAQPTFSNVPIVVCGLAPDFYTGTANRQAIQDYIEATPSRETLTGYATTDGLASEGGDDIHLSGSSNRTLGGTNAWTAFLAAEDNV